MHKLTERRLANAQAVLDRYRADLFDRHSFNAPSLERELRELWKLGHREMESIAHDMLKNERYREVAAYYMEHSNPGTGVAARFKLPLASLYGVKSYNASDRENMRKKFWADVYASVEA